MKKSYLLILFSFLLIPFFATNGQIFVENFDYPVGDSLTQHGWVAHSAATTNPIFVTSPGLTYTGYPSSGIGNAATISGSGQDVNQQFTPLTSGAIYASLMVNVASAQTGDYFFHLGLSNTTSIYMGRVYVKVASNGNIQFGLSKTSLGGTLNITAVYSDSIYTTGATYLLVLKYQFNPDINDDVAYLFINPVISTSEPTPDLMHNLSNNDDPADIGGVYIRQGSSTSAASLTLDGIQIGTSWSDVIPVELTSFTAELVNGNVLLNWSTATETNNSGFEIQRKDGINEFEAIGFVSGYGTTTENKTYSFVDGNLTSGNYTYRLKQIDFDGSFSFSDEVNVDVTNPLQFELSQNYPNPFNPSTTINYSLAEKTLVTLKVYDMIGNEVATLINTTQEAGNYDIKFNASNFSSGLYIYQLNAGSFTSIKKMMLLK